MKKEGIDYEPKLTYALNENGEMVSILSVENGLSCKCKCPKCKRPLVAKHGEGGRQPHFAHLDTECHGAYMTALHRLSEQIIQREKAVMAPFYQSIPADKLIFENVEIEERNDRNDLQPDVVGVTEDGLRWHIEIVNTHKVDDKKIAKIKDSDIICLEIDVSEQFLESLKDFLLNSTESRNWVNNPIYEERINKEKQEKERLDIEKYNRYSNDKRYAIKKELFCRRECNYFQDNGYCKYFKDEFLLNNKSFFVCDSERKNKDEYQTLDFDYNNQSLEEIIAQLDFGRTIQMKNGIIGEILKIAKRINADEIVLACDCNDRVYPLQIINVKLLDNRLCYKIMSRNQEKDIKIAIKKFKKALYTDNLDD